MDKQFNYCPIEITLRAIGGKYKPVILFHLLKGTRRYKELQREIICRGRTRRCRTNDPKCVVLMMRCGR
jgi:hypothetical protein